MRVSQALVGNIVRQSADRAARTLLEASKPLRDETAVASPSADPIKANRVMALDRLENDFDRFERARGLVANDLSSAENSITAMYDLVVQARDLALAIATDSIDPQTRRESASQTQRFTPSPPRP